jgi:hypothetical protein
MVTLEVRLSSGCRAAAPASNLPGARHRRNRTRSSKEHGLHRAGIRHQRRSPPEFMSSSLTGEM